MLIINDGGTDVRRVVEGFNDPRLKYLNLAENRGKAACLNLGLERARGSYVAYLDDDDIWYPNHLSTLVRALDDNPQVGVAYSDLYAVVFLKGEDGRRYPLEKRICVCRDYNRMLMFHFNHTFHVSLMHHKDLAFRAGGYDESIRVLIDWDLTRKLSFYTDFLHVQVTTGEYFQPVAGSDRISDVQRKDAEGFQQNLRRIRADLPPEPWPMVKRVAVVLPVTRWDEAGLATVRYLLDKLDYPCRIVLVNRDAALAEGRSAALAEADCRRALRPLAELKNLTVMCAAGGGLHDAYLAGARSTEADFYYLPSDRVCRQVDLRLTKGVCYMGETRCAAVRWGADETEGPYDILLSREALFSAAHADWPRPAVVPRGWMPDELKADEMLFLASEYEREGNYAAAQRFLDAADAVERGGTGDAYMVQLYASIAFGLGDYRKAERMCENLIAQGYGADNYVRLGRIYQSQGRHGPALEAYRRGLAGIGLAEADVDAGPFPFTCLADFDAFHAMVGQAECLLELGRDEEAARALRRAARLRANSHRPYVAFARLFLKHGELQSAAEALGMAAEQDLPPRDASVEAGFAAVRERQGQLELAFEWACRALAKCPENEELLATASRLGERLGRTEATAALYRRFLSYHPGHVPALVGLAAACRRLGRHDEARELSDRAAVLAASSDAGNAPGPASQSA
jgi:tetratricopeptide (TPR) repeat protein